MKFKDLVVAKPEELLLELSKARRELHDLQIGNKLRQLKDTHKIRDRKKDIARILTAMKEIGVSSANVPVFESGEETTGTSETSPKESKKTTTKDSMKTAKKRTTKKTE